jgi:hypothetical protein
MFHEGKRHQDLVQWLYDVHGIKISLRTLKSRFKEWEISKRVAPEDEERIKHIIKALYFQVGLDDKDMLVDLKRQGYQIGPGTLVRLRLELGLKRRIRSPEEIEQAERVVQDLVQEGIQSGAIDGYGKQYLYLHFRQLGMNVARDRMFQVYRTLNPTGIERRNQDRQRRKGEYLVRGPNFIWSIDGHEKLKPYGFEIYACIDAYARYIVWVYVGISAGTAVSVGQQYLNAVRETGVIPHYIRSDCGKETSQLAYAHFRLSDANEPNCPFEKCYMYGTSTANQRIESWWQQLSKSLLFRWRVSHYTKENQNGILSYLGIL